MKRRSLLLGALGLPGVLLVGWSLLPPRQRLHTADTPSTSPEGRALNGWIRLDADGLVIVSLPRSEMGQGISTAAAMLAAEELDLPLDRVRTQQAPQDRIFANTAVVVDALSPHRHDDEAALARAGRWMARKLGREFGPNVTGGSSSVKDLWQPLREAGAQARATLVGAAAALAGVDPAQCRTAGGAVLLPSGERLAYGEILRRAPPLEPATRFAPKPASQWTLIGRPATRIDARDKVEGRAVYGLDVRLPGQRYAALLMAPSRGARLLGYEAPPGVQVLRLPAGQGQDEALAVIADRWWAARRAVGSIVARWDESAGAGLSSAAYLAAQAQALDADPGDDEVYDHRGSPEATFASAARRLDAQYGAPYLAHATLEPMNCTAQVAEGRVRVWAPTQVPDFSIATAAAAAGVDEDAVELHITELGGGFGRRLEVDFVAQAVRIAREAEGRPVQLIWTREQDTTHDHYRTAATCRLSAALDAQGRVLALTSRSASAAMTPDFLGRVAPQLPAIGPDKTTVEGLAGTPYQVPHQRHAHRRVPSPLPVGNWRAVGHSMNGFFIEGFIDEIAAETGRDPLALRRELLAGRPRHLAVLDLLAERAGWSTQRRAEAKAQGRGLGLAMHESFSSVCAQVMEVSLQDGRPRVHRVVCVVDMGTVLNPDIAAQQLEGAVVMGLTAALYGRIDLEAGRVVQQSFTDYRLLPPDEAPVVETHFLPADGGPPRGIGEPGLPPVAPALASALHALTGRRLRQLPFTL